jgi:hypothetical protein
MKVFKCLIVFSAMVAFAGCKKDKIVMQTNATVIPNGDFENWDNMSLLENWKTNSCPACVPPFETYIVQRDTNAYHGKFAAKFIYNNVYAAWAENKFKLDGHPASLTAYTKCNLYGNDTVSVKIRLFRNSAVIDSGQWFGTSSINTYTKIVIPISQNSLQADSAQISIKGGHKIGYPSKNTEFWVDYLTLQ